MLRSMAVTVLVSFACAGCSSSIDPDATTDVAAVDANDIVADLGGDAPGPDVPTSDVRDAGGDGALEDCGVPSDAAVCTTGNACVLCSAGPQEWSYCVATCTTPADCHDPNRPYCIRAGCNNVQYCSPTASGCGCGICAPETATIATPNGERPIAEIAVGDVVYGTRRAALVPVRVVQVIRRRVWNHSVVRVTLANGRVVEMSAPHPTFDGAPFATLAAGDALDGVRVTFIDVVPYAGEYTYDLRTDGDRGAYVADGVVVGSTLAAE